MTAAGAVAVTGQILHLPDVDLAARIPALADRVPAEPACPPERAHELLGRKGLLGKDAATRLALCAVHRALGLPVRAARSSGPPDPGTAVVCSSNLGNVSSVVGVARSVREGGRHAVSPLAAPNASSNVVASTVAIWFRCGGPNLMVCSGATSGLDAVALGTLLLRTGRARRVLVVGTEPADEDAVALYQRSAGASARLCGGAACVVLEPAASDPGAPVLGPVRTLRRDPGGDLLVFRSRQAGHSGTGVDLAATCGDLYGAQGVALVALAAYLAGQAGSVRVTCGGDADGWRTVDVGRAFARSRLV